METGLTFVIGGARSGKSAYAVMLATRLGPPTLYLATAETIDTEMRERIRRHRTKRPRSWRTLEEPLKLARPIASRVHPGSVVIVDCLTVWLGNLLEKHVRDASNPRKDEAKRARRQALEELQLLCGLPEKKRINLIVISNEVGTGLVPPYPLGRIYRDILGEANQLVADRATSVHLLVAGIPVDVKALADKLPDGKLSHLGRREGKG